MSDVSESSPIPRRSIFSVLLTVLSSVVLLTGFVLAMMQYIENRSVATEIEQLEEELGTIHVTDPERVYFVAIDNEKVPNVVSESVDRIWQFRYYLPAGYNPYDFQGHGRLMAEGFYFEDASASYGSNSPLPEAINKRLSISLTKKKNRFEIYSSVTGTTYWQPRNLDVKIEDLVIKPVVSLGDPARSFGPDEIIPLLRIYAPASAKKKMVNGQKQTIYSGVLLVLCTSSQERRFELLREGNHIELDAGSEETNRE